MKDRILFVAIFGIVILLVTGSASGYLGSFNKGECVNLVVPINASGVNITNINSPSPNSQILISNVVMTKTSNLFNYSFCNTTKVGTYTYGFCDNLGNCYSNSFGINELTIQNAMFYIIILILLVVLFILSINKFFTATSIVGINAFLSISYFVLIAITFMAEQIVNNFMPTLPAIGAFLNLTLIILIVGLLPLILGLILYTLSQTIQSRKDARMVAMGYSSEEVKRYRKK